MSKRITEEETIVNFFTANANTPKGETVFNIVKGIMRRPATRSKTKSTEPSGNKPTASRTKSANSAASSGPVTSSSTTSGPQDDSLPM